MSVDIPVTAEGATLTGAALKVHVDALDAATELSLFATDTPVPAGVVRTTEPPHVQSPATTTTAHPGTVTIDALPAVEAMLRGEATALAVAGMPARAFLAAPGTANAPHLELTYATSDPDDTTAPTVSISSPSFGETVFGQVAVTADAADDSGVVGVTVTLGGRLVGTDDTAPYDVQIDTTVVPDGEHPLAVEAVDASGNAARALIPLVVDNGGGPLHRLDLDFAADRIDVDTYVLQGLAAVLRLPELQPRYAGSLPEEVTVWTWRTLQYLPDMTPENRAKAEKLITPVDLETAANEPVEPTQSGIQSFTAAAATDVDCNRVRGFVFAGYDCLIHVGEVTLYWNSDHYDVPRGDIPSQVDAAATGLENAQDHLEDVLGFQPIEGVEAFMDIGLIEGRAISLPNEVILLNRDDDSLAATAGHELVHQYQYEYIDILDNRSLGRMSDIGWWMEASAEWASHQMVAAYPGDYAEDDEEEYLRNIELFLEQPTKDLMAWESSTNRQYGAFVFAEWLHHDRGVDAVRSVWEEFDRSGSIRDGLVAVAPNAASWLPTMWRDMYTLDLAIPGRVDQGVTDRWREELEPNPATAPYESLTANRPVESVHHLAEGDSAVEPVELGPGGGTFVELDLDVDRTVLVTLRPDATDGGLDLETLPLAAYDLDPATAPQSCDVPAMSGTATVVEYDPSVCDGLSVIVANTSLNDSATGLLTIEVGNRVDTTISNGVVRLGIHAEGHLNVPGYEASSGTGTSTVGLRYMPTNADSLSPGCECEGWGVADVGRDVGGSANESWGGVRGLSLVNAGFDDDSGTSIVRAGPLGELTVRHDFVPAPETPNLYRVDVTVTNSTSSLGGLLGGYYGPLTPTYRRVMDWDVEPTAFSEFVTIDAEGGALPREVVAATNDGFADPDPRSPATDLGGVGLFTDLGPDDHGALFDVQLPELDPGESTFFTMWYGAAETSAVALAALGAVGADAWSLAEPDVPDGATVGSPNTFAFGLAVHHPVIRALAAAEPSDGPTSTPRNDGVVRQ
ncbi:Ig-like domain-containing protein [Nocardioides astragali]|uniref:Ig-like domain-containing protein n=1 Tax=Nocardioides astragali TaxID=1776736 RepID=A0ABW2MW48_9ACTN|nr:Ig-like domain-containing protein [Nocardioides astragali]